MIYAVKNNEVNRAIYKDNEDALTSSIFERLLYLPHSLLQYIFKTVLFDKTADTEWKEVESITYWPSWNPTNTANSK